MQSKRQAPRKRREKRKARQAARKARNERRDARRARELAERAARSGAATPAGLRLDVECRGAAQRPLRVVPASVQAMMAAILADRSGATARVALRSIGLRRLASATRRAALCDGRFRWSSMRARRCVATSFFLDAMRTRCRRSGGWKFHVDGVPVDYLRWLLRDPHQPPVPREYARAKRYPNGRTYRSARGVPSQGALTGSYQSGGRWDDAQCGVITALRQLGVVFSLHNGATPKVYATASGYQPVEFLLACDVLPEDPDQAAVVERAIIEELAMQIAEQEADARAPPLVG